MPSKIKGTNGEDTLLGTLGADLIWARDGDDLITANDGADRVWGNRGHDRIDLGAGDDRAHGGRDNDTIDGGDGTDRLHGGRGNDILDGGAGDDRLRGGKDDDTLNGGAGSDDVRGGRGDDMLIYNAADNDGSFDSYRGGRDDDTLVLQFSLDEWSNGALRDEVRDFQAFLQTTSGQGRGQFDFQEFGLTVRNVENLVVEVDGQVVDPLAPVLVTDDFATDEDSAVSGGLLDNDDLPVSGAVTGFSGATDQGGSVTVNADGTFGYTPDADFFGTDGFSYTFVDDDGRSATADVTVEVAPVNDAPTVSEVSANGNEDDPLTASFSGDDVDGDALSYQITSSVDAGTGTLVNNGDGTFTFTPGEDLQALNGGESQDVSFTYTATDGDGAVSAEGTATLSIDGADDIAANPPPVFIGFVPFEFTGEEEGGGGGGNQVGTGYLEFSDVDETGAAHWVNVVGTGTSSLLDVDEANGWGLTSAASSANLEPDGIVRLPVYLQSGGGTSTPPDQLTFEISFTDDNVNYINQTFTLDTNVFGI